MDKLVDIFRPTKFDEVWGQANAVSFLSGLITNGKRERNVLLYGQIGSGKTTLARIYAAALNCEAYNRENGSPCGECGPCKSARMPHSPLFREISAPIYKSGETLEKEVEAINREPRESVHRIIFIDEAQALAEVTGAVTKLLKLVEDAPEGIVYILATSELDRVPAALRSRFVLLMVRPLSREASRHFMSKIIASCGFDNPGSLALDLIAGFSEYQPRNMLHCLDQLLPDPISVDRVRQVFGSPQIELLVAYFEHIALGNSGAAMAQFLEWPETTAIKISLIRSMLLHIYLRSFHRMDVVIDPLIASIKTASMSRIVNLYAERIGLNRSDPMHRWRDMVVFWRGVPQNRDEEASMLDVALFHETACNPAASSSAHHTQEKPSIAIFPSSNSVDPIWGMRPRSVRRKKCNPKKSYLGYEAVQKIINSASACTQAYNLRLNVCITLWCACFETDASEDNSKLMSAFTKSISEWTRRHDKLNFSCWITTREFDSDRGYCARMISYIPHEVWEEFQEWSLGWRLNTRIVSSGQTAIEVDLPPNPPKSITVRDARHKECVRWLLASTDPEEKVWDPKLVRPGYESLRALLGLGKDVRHLDARDDRRQIVLSSALGKTNLTSKATHRMYFLSAFNDNAWDRLMGSWEYFEYEHRRLEAEKRETEWREATSATFAGGASNSAPLTEEANALLQAWSEDAHERPRSWSVWWPQDEL